MYEVFPLFRPIVARPRPRMITTVVIAGSGTGARFSVNEAKRCVRACLRACVACDLRRVRVRSVSRSDNKNLDNAIVYTVDTRGSPTISPCPVSLYAPWKHFPIVS